MENINFTATVLAGTGKAGVLVPDPGDYYTMCIGALNIENSVGCRYVYQTAKSLFEADADLMRRLSTGNLKGEVGHPRRLPGMTDDQWFDRILDIDPTNVCVYWAEIGLDESYGRNNPQFGNSDMVGIMARFRPGGVRGEFLARDLADPSTNVCFSIRSFSDRYERMGRVFYDLKHITTWDYVNEPGLHVANKYDSPTLENLEQKKITLNMVKAAMDKTLVGGVTLESKPQLAQMAKIFKINTGVSKPVSILKTW